MNSNQRLNLSLNIYFSLTTNQKRKLDSMGYSHVTLELTPMADFKRITQNKQLHKDLITLKRSFFRLIDAA